MCNQKPLILFQHGNFWGGMSPLSPLPYAPACSHRLNGSSSPVLTATGLSYRSLCDFLGFFYGYIHSGGIRN